MGIVRNDLDPTGSGARRHFCQSITRRFDESHSDAIVPPRVNYPIVLMTAVYPRGSHMLAQRGGMSRRAFAGGLGTLVASLPNVCLAQSWPTTGYWGVWKRIPSILVVSDPKDPRLPAVYDAVAFWNAMFSNLGSPFRLGSVSHIAETVPPQDSLRNFHRGLDQVLQIVGSNNMILLDHVRDLNGDVVIALLNGPTSFFAASGGSRKVLVVIRDHRTYSSDKSNELLVTIAHELGHVIGLDHNDDETALMCGSNCIDTSKRFLSLTKYEKNRILHMYPAGWRGDASR